MKRSTARKIAAFFAAFSAAAIMLAASAVTENTEWWEVPPTNTLAQVFDAAGVAKTNILDNIELDRYLKLEDVFDNYDLKGHFIFLDGIGSSAFLKPWALSVLAGQNQAVYESRRITLTDSAMWNIYLYFPTNSSGTFALTSDISAATNRLLRADTASMTSPGVVTDWLIDNNLYGGVRIRYSSRNLDNYTTYAYNGVAVRRDGATSDYLFDATHTNGIVRRTELASYATTGEVADIVRDLSLGGIWDETLQVWWTPRMRNGSLTYEATTNVNLNAEN